MVFQELLGQYPSMEPPQQDFYRDPFLLENYGNEFVDPGIEEHDSRIHRGGDEKTPETDEERALRHNPLRPPGQKPLWRSPFNPDDYPEINQRPNPLV